MKTSHPLPHKYEKRDLGSLKPYYVQACSLKNCTHYLSFNAVIGMESICWRCGTTFIMTKKSSALKYPRCLTCKPSRRKDVAPVDKDAIAAALGRIGIK